MTKRSDWKTCPAPEKRESLGYEAVFSEAEAERMTAGLLPEEMEDKWFVYFEDGWLFFHRSWTGFLIFWIRLDGCPAGVRVVESWVSREAEEYCGTDLAGDRGSLDVVIRRVLLG